MVVNGSLNATFSEWRSLLQADAAEERQELIVRWNDTKRAYPRDATIPQLFAEQVRNSPDSVAGVYGERTLTYRELDLRSNRVARRLRGSSTVAVWGGSNSPRWMRGV